MDSQELRNLFDYMFWAHERMMRPVYEVSPDEFTRDLKMGHASLRDTLVHMMSAEWIWLSRWHGISPHAMLDPTGFTTLDSVDERWGSLRHELQRFLGQIRDEDLVAPVVYRNVRGEELTLPLICTLQHLLNHNTYHRGQVASIVRLLGREPVSTDLVLFFLEDEARAARQRPRWEIAPAFRGGNDEGDEEDED